MKRLLGVLLAASLPLVACAPAPNAPQTPDQTKMGVKFWRGPLGGLHAGFGLNRPFWGYGGYGAIGMPRFGYGAFASPWIGGYGLGAWGLGGYGWGWGLGAAAWPYPWGYAGLGLGTYGYGLGYGGLGYGLGYGGFDPNPLINNPLIPGLR